MAAFFFCSHVAFSRYSLIPGISSSSCMDTSPILLETHPYGLSLFIPSLKALLPNTVQLRVRTSNIWISGEHNSVHNTHLKTYHFVSKNTVTYSVNCSSTHGEGLPANQKHLQINGCFEIPFSLCLLEMNNSGDWIMGTPKYQLQIPGTCKCYFT